MVFGPPHPDRTHVAMHAAAHCKYGLRCSLSESSASDFTAYLPAYLPNRLYVKPSCLTPHLLDLRRASLYREAQNCVAPYLLAERRAFWICAVPSSKPLYASATSPTKTASNSSRSHGEVHFKEPRPMHYFGCRHLPPAFCPANAGPLSSRCGYTPPPIIVVCDDLHRWGEGGRIS